LLDTDTNGLNEENIKENGCSEEEIQSIKDIYDSVPVLTAERIKELFGIIEQCMIELDKRKSL
jgi:hypothetical protein